MNDDRTLLPEQSRQAFERAYAAIPAITPTKETAWQIWNAALSASPLPQEPQEGKALTDERICELAKEHFGGCGHDLIWHDDPSHAAACDMPKDARWSTSSVRAEQTLALARAIERELRGAQEGKVGEWLPPLPDKPFAWDTNGLTASPVLTETMLVRFPEFRRPSFGPLFTADQLRARDRQIVELCAALCDQYEMAKWEAYKHGHGPERASDYTQGQSDGAGDCGNAIRALLDEKKGNE